jgi:hypothetical protein
MMAIQFYGITHDPLRISNKSQYITINKSIETNSVDTYLTQVPYNFDFQVSVICNYMVEMDQILEQILAYFNPFIYIRLAIDEIPGQHFDVRVVFTSASPDTPTQFAETEYRIIGWTLYFTVYAYLFTPVTKNSLTRTIVTKYYTDQDLMDIHSGTESMFTSGGSGSYESEAVLLKAIGYEGDDVDYEETIFSVEDYTE